MTRKTRRVALLRRFVERRRVERRVDQRRQDKRRLDERGDVPGWVMITVMTVAIVGAIWAVADDQLTTMLTNALNSVSKG